MPPGSRSRGRPLYKAGSHLVAGDVVQHGQGQHHIECLLRGQARPFVTRQVCHEEAGLHPLQPGGHPSGMVDQAPAAVDADIHSPFDVRIQKEGKTPVATAQIEYMTNRREIAYNAGVSGLKTETRGGKALREGLVEGSIQL